MSHRRRTLEILQSRLATTPGEIATILGVSMRTVINQLSTLNREMEGFAHISSVRGSRRLEVLDAEAMTRFEAQMRSPALDLNDGSTRQALLFDRLAAVYAPIPVEQLARELTVGRSTAHQDLSALRTAIAPYGLRILGRPHVGVKLEGSELKIRLVLLDRFAEVLYDPSPVPDRLLLELAETCGCLGLGAASTDVISRWFTVMFARLSAGREIPLLCEDERLFADLVENSAFARGQELASLAGEWLDAPVTPQEAMFMTLPLVGMRSPDQVNPWALYLAAEDPQRLREAICERIQQDTGITLDLSRLGDEFTLHLGFLINRVRYGIQVSGHDSTSWGSRFPVAHQMALLAAREVADRLGSEVADAEIGLLTAYFQVFVQQSLGADEPQLRIGAVYPHGKVEAELLSCQIREAVAGVGQVVAISDSTLIDQDSTALDLLVVREECPLPRDPGVPVIRVGALFDSLELRRRLAALAIRHELPGAGRLGGASWLGTLLENEAVVNLTAQEADAGLHEMLTALYERGLIDDALRCSVLDRDARSSVQISDRLSFPHVTAPLPSPLLAIGLAPHTENGHVIVLAVVPEDTTTAPELLVNLWDEVLSLHRDADLLSELCALTTAHQVRTALAVHATDRRKASE